MNKDLSGVASELLLEELESRRVTVCAACAENDLLKQQLQDKDHELEGLLYRVSDLERLLDSQRESFKGQNQQSITHGQQKVLDAARAGDLYVSHNGTGHHFSLVPGRPCYHLTCPVGQAEWERRLTEGE